MAVLASNTSIALLETTHTPFRRLYMKRRLSGEYEADWVRIPQKYILSFGKVTVGIEDIKINFIKYSGLNFTVSNLDGFFSDITDRKSFFYGATSVYRTLVKVECGYTYNGEELPTATTMFVGIIGENYKYKEDTKITFNTKHLSSIFDEMPASQLPGLTTSNYTASEFITKIKDYVDSNSISVFQKYITSSGWFISATTDNYIFVTNSTLEGSSCWDAMRQLAESENMSSYVDKSGDFYFQSKTPLTATATYHFSGVGDPDKSYGHNIIGGIQVNDSLQKVYNRIRIQYDKDDTSASYKTREETWSWGDSTSSFLYGVRTLKYKNVFMDSAKASTAADDFYNEYSSPKKEVTFKAKYVPFLDINDRVSLTYKTRQVSEGSVWGYFKWGEGVWGDSQGFNINIENEDFRVIKMEHSFDQFYSNITLREI